MGICSGKYAAAIRLEGMTAIVTGCNTGIGKYTAMDLYSRGCKVIMACRDVKKAGDTRETIQTECKNKEGTGQLVVRALDLASLSSVREFAADILKTETRIQLLINNAGVMLCPELRTAEGFELQFGTNHLGHFLLTLLLLPRIITSAPSRIVNLSSDAHKVAGEIDWDNLNAEKSYGSLKQYGLSKVANILFTKELHRRLQEVGAGVTVYAVHPGVVNTDLSRNLDQVSFPGASWLYRNLGGVFQKNEAQGAATTLHCAIDPSTESESGLYYADMKVATCTAQAEDAEKAKRLWDVSRQLVQLDGSYDPFKSSSGQ